MAAATRPNEYLARMGDGSVVGLQAAPCDPLPRGTARFVTQQQSSTVSSIDPLCRLPDQARQHWEQLVGDVAYRSPGVASLDRSMGEVHSGSPARRDNAPDATSSPLPAQGQIHQNKVHAFQESARLLLSSFVMSTGSAGEGPAEKQFTPVIQRILKLKQDLLQTAFGCFIPPLTETANLLNSGKKLVKPIKEFSRTGKRSLLNGASEHIRALMKFAMEHRLKCSPDVIAFYVKSVFFEKAAVSEDDALQFLGSHTFDDDAMHLTMEKPGSPAGIVQHCIGAMVLSTLQGPINNEGWDYAWVDQRKALATMSQKYED